MEWQLEHPNGSKEECVAWLDEQFTKGLVDLSSDPPAYQKRVKNGSGNAAKKVKR
jgi:tRNA nucleotidyltransferase (CCA-adding enzyme)